MLGSRSGSNYPEYAEHELKAFAELLLRTGREFEVLGSTAVNVVADREELRRRVLWSVNRQ